MEPTRTLARRLWEAIEPIHAVAYFDSAATDATNQLGLRGFWMGYFAARVAPLGALNAEPTTAMTFGFSPDRVARAVPTAWSIATPDAVLDTRLQSATGILRSHLGRRFDSEIPALAELLADSVEGCAFDARPLAAGWAAVKPPDDPLGRIWLAATVLREHRGDGHVLAAVALGLRGIDAVVTHVATGSVTRGQLQQSRGWTDEQWEASQRRTRALGLTDRDGRLTRRGGTLRRELEATTDRLAAGPIERLGPHGVERIIELATPLSRHLIDTAVVPVPNPIGAPRP